MSRKSTAPAAPAAEVPGIPRSARAAFRALFDAPLDPPSWLRAEVDRYLAEVRAAARRKEFVDVDLAERIAAALRVLFDALDHEWPEPRRRAVQAAARYFGLEEDGAHDTDSEIGFYDDAEVLNAVVRYLGRPDLVVALPR